MYSRHDLVWLTAQGWKGANAAARPEDRASLALWERQDWPAVVRRRDIGAPDCTVSLGISLPPASPTAPKQRIALRVSTAHVRRHTPALGLGEAAAAAPGAWRAGLSAMADEFPGLLAYGSLAMQAITGLPYLSPASDVDVLLAPRCCRSLERALALMTAQAQSLPLDGEIVFPSGDAVAWKEWRDAGPRARVLVKTIDAVRLAERAALLATLEAA